METKSKMYRNLRYTFFVQLVRNMITVHNSLKLLITSNKSCISKIVSLGKRSTNGYGQGDFLSIIVPGRKLSNCTIMKTGMLEHLIKWQMILCVQGLSFI